MSVVVYCCTYQHLSKLVVITLSRDLGTLCVTFSRKFGARCGCVRRSWLTLILKIVALLYIVINMNSNRSWLTLILIIVATSI